MSRPVGAIVALIPCQDEVATEIRFHMRPMADDTEPGSGVKLLLVESAF